MNNLMDKISNWALTFRLSQCLFVITKLKIPDLLKNGPKNAEQLAKELNIESIDYLNRIMRFVSSDNFFKENIDGTFELNEQSEQLLSSLFINFFFLYFFLDSPTGLKDYIGHMFGIYAWMTYGNLYPSLKKGICPFRYTFNEESWEYFNKHPNDYLEFNSCIQRITQLSTIGITEKYDFSKYSVIMDVGGGYGYLLQQIINKHPNIKGILFDTPNVIQQVKNKLISIETIEGNFFEKLPEVKEKNSLIILKSVLHDWNDEKCLIILKNCYKALQGENAKLLVIENILPPPGNSGPSTIFGKSLDIQMLVMCDGKERTEKEFSNLFKETGFILKNISSMNRSYLIEADKI
jgi:hypothetical protein